MSPRHLVLAVVLAVVAASVGVGAATPDDATASSLAASAAADQPAPLGESISSMMQASAAQAAGTVENGMWVAAYANASNATEKRALVEARYGELNTTVGELQAERAALQEQYRNGTINRTTYLARLSAIVGQLAALGEGIEEAGDRGAQVGVNGTRLDELRSQARNLTGAEVSRLARNLTGGQGPPGPSGLFEGPPGRSGEAGPSNASNSSSPGGPSNSTQAGNSTSGGHGQDPPAANESTTSSP